MDKYIVRGDRSGVFYGEIVERNGSEVTIANCRRLWFWSGANSLSQLAQFGTTKPTECKFSCYVDLLLVLDAIEIDLCSDVAQKSIEGVQEWISE